MDLFTVKGVVTAIGQSEFNNDITLYAYIEITEDSGRRVSVQKVAVCNEAASGLWLGSEGEFFFDKVFFFETRFRSQLWGIKSESAVVFDHRDLRVYFMVYHLVAGLVLLPVVGVGLLCLLPSVSCLCKVLSGSVDRKGQFYGANPAEIKRLQQQEMVRI